MRRDIPTATLKHEPPLPFRRSISWDRWFEWFDRNELALPHDDDSRFNELVRRH